MDTLGLLGIGGIEFSFLMLVEIMVDEIGDSSSDSALRYPQIPRHIKPIISKVTPIIRSCEWCFINKYTFNK